MTNAELLDYVNKTAYEGELLKSHFAFNLNLFDEVLMLEYRRAANKVHKKQLAAGYLLKLNVDPKIVFRGLGIPDGTQIRMLMDTCERHLFHARLAKKNKSFRRTCASGVTFAPNSLSWRAELNAKTTENNSTVTNIL